MRLLSTRRDRSATHKAQPYRHEPYAHPELLGDWISHQFFKDRFGLPAAHLQSLVARLPWELQNPAILWILFYLSWTLKEYAASKYGMEFARDLRVQTSKRLKQAEGIWEEMRGIGEVFQFWMDELDRTALRAGTEMESLESPFEIFAATTFLTEDPGSSFYQIGGPNNLECNIGHVLTSARSQVIGLIQTVVDSDDLVGKYSALEAKHSLES